MPPADAEIALFQRTDHGSHCPYKGDAGYYSLAVEGRRAANAVRVYEQRYPAVAESRDQLSLYPDRVDRIKCQPTGELEASAAPTVRNLRAIWRIWPADQ